MVWWYAVSFGALLSHSFSFFHISCALARKTICSWGTMLTEGREAWRQFAFFLPTRPFLCAPLQYLFLPNVDLNGLNAESIATPQTWRNTRKSWCKDTWAFFLETIAACHWHVSHVRSSIQRTSFSCGATMSHLQFAGRVGTEFESIRVIPLSKEV